MNLIGPIHSGAAEGGAGAAGANADSPTIIKGRVLAVYVGYNGSPPAAADVLIQTKGVLPAAPSNTILALNNTAASGWFYPHHKAHDENGTVITYDGSNEVYTLPPVYDHINVSLAQANDGDSIDVWLLVEEV